MKIYLPTKERPDAELFWIAKVMYEDTVAFYAVKKSLKKIQEQINYMSLKYFPNLLELPNVTIQMKKWYMSELRLNRLVVCNISEDLESELEFKTDLPARKIIPIEYELLPIMDFEYKDVGLWSFLEKRDILVLDEIKNIVKKKMVGAMVEIDSKLYWHVDVGSKKFLVNAITGEVLNNNLNELLNSIQISIESDIR
ncbi:MAG: hypothetical protein GF329_21460 [Candidatus Lokiarchaeota archaeon]|nr:hypothetical protein [Candidatus Lokiarchaeota archaeon]